MKQDFFPWLVVTAGFLVLAWQERQGPWPPLRIVGALLCVLGFASVTLARYHLARYHLGRSFSVSPQARQLVTTGIYARFSNPICVFGVVLVVGTALCLQSWPISAFAFVLIPVQIVRARKEAAVLEAAFGEEYRRYRANTWL